MPDRNLGEAVLRNPLCGTLADMPFWGDGLVSCPKDGKDAVTVTARGGAAGLRAPFAKESAGTFLLELDFSAVTAPVEIFFYACAPSGTCTRKKLAQADAAGLFCTELDLNEYAAHMPGIDLSRDECGAELSTCGGFTLRTAQWYHRIYAEIDGRTCLNGYLDRLLAESSRVAARVNALEQKRSGLFRDENGAGYFLQVSGGALRAVPALPRRSVWLGNSLLNGWGTFGMAASYPDEDYMADTLAVIRAQLPASQAVRLAGYGFEEITEPAHYAPWLEDTLSADLDDTVDLVVIQLSDNINTPEKCRAFCTYGAKALCRYVRSHAPGARVVWLSAWFPHAENQKAIETACSDTGCTFLDISDLNTAENDAHLGDIVWMPDGTAQTITVPGIALHPSSRGMYEIAKRLCGALGISYDESIRA